MSLYKRGKIWWSRIERGGQLIQRSTKCANINDARRVEDVWKSDYAKGEVGIYRAPTLSEFSTQFLSYLPSRVAKRTFRFYVDAWMPLLESPLAHVKLSQIDGKKLEELFIQDRLKVVSPTTVNHSLRTLRRALHLAADWKLIPRAPRISLLKGEKGREYVIDEPTLERFVALSANPETVDLVHFHARKFHPEMAALLPFLVDTGLGAGEVCRLNREDVNLEGRGSVFVRTGKSANARRYVPLTARARRIIESLPKSTTTDALFTRNGRRITITWASHQFTAMRRKLGLPEGCVLHSTRHTFCSRLGANGASPFDIQRLAGHASMLQSQKYVHPGAAQLDAAIARLEPHPG